MSVTHRQADDPDRKFGFQGQSEAHWRSSILLNPSDISKKIPQNSLDSAIEAPL